MESKRKSKDFKRAGQAIMPKNRLKREATDASIVRSTTAVTTYSVDKLIGMHGRRTRSISPGEKGNTKSSLKTRRCRSAGDIIDMIMLENVGDKQASVNELSMISMVNGNAAATATAVKTSTASIKAASVGALTKRKSSTIQTNVKSLVNSKKEATLKPTSSAVATTVVSQTGSTAKTVNNKRIPPYDFKARYHDLFEKHQVLKKKHQQSVEQLETFDDLHQQFEQCKTDLTDTKVQLDTRTFEYNKLASSASNLKTVTTDLVKSIDELNALKEELENLKQKYLKLFEKSQQFEEIKKENEFLHNELVVCKEQLFRSNMERKMIHNDLMNLRGNIRVFCRVRPTLPCENDRALCGWNYIDEATVEIVNYDALSKKKLAAHTFTFDYIFQPNSLQEDIFESVAPLIQSALDGYNICIFAYGQTGSGKTFTMDGGIASKIGVIPRTVDLLFCSVEGYKKLGWEYTIKATFLEIYNEVLYDLLSREQKDLEIRMANNSNKNDIYVSNLTEAKVETPEQLRQLMELAKMNRATASTIGNERSSRSHAVTKIELTGFHAEKNEYSVGAINLIDLAGSESPKTSQRMTETKNINRSLSELTNVILALLQKQDHIPYRNSKLTHLLMPALGGNSKTLMFINVAPFLDCYTESLKSLRFAASVNSCKNAKAKRNRYFTNSF